MTDKLKYYFFEWIVPIAVAVIITFIIRSTWFYLVEVPTGSMEPTIMPKDRIVVTKIYNLEKSVKRGDVIVFDSDELKKVLIKRLIGLPGDEVIIDNDGKMTINGEKVDEPYVVNQSRTPAKFKVPERKYLFLGDNRANSHDARAWVDKYIPAEKIQAKAQFIIFPFNRIQFLK